LAPRGVFAREGSERLSIAKPPRSGRERAGYCKRPPWKPMADRGLTSPVTPSCGGQESRTWKSSGWWQSISKREVGSRKPTTIMESSSSRPRASRKPQASSRRRRLKGPTGCTARESYGRTDSCPYDRNKADEVRGTVPRVHASLALLVHEGLSQAKNSRSPEADEDRQSLALAAVQRNRDQDRSKSSHHVDDFACTHTLPPLLFSLAHYTLARNK